MDMTLSLPRNYIEIEQDEMMYLDGGGFYTNYGTICSLVVGLGVSISSSLYTITVAIQTAATLVTGMIGGAFCGIGTIIAIGLRAWIVKQAGNIAERVFSAVGKRKGVEWGIEWKWLIIPEVGGTIR